MSSFGRNWFLLPEEFGIGRAQGTIFRGGLVDIEKIRNDGGSLFYHVKRNLPWQLG
jgi:hypothetical protein